MHSVAKGALLMGAFFHTDIVGRSVDAFPARTARGRRAQLKTDNDVINDINSSPGGPLRTREEALGLHVFPRIGIDLPQGRR